jgi:CRP-like cAMP-binding protein
MHKLPQDQLPVENRLLSALPRVAYQRLAEHLETIDLTEGQVLCEPGEVMRYVYFPVTALLIFVNLVDGHKAFAVGMTGSEGMCNVNCALGSNLSPFRTLVQCSGKALRMKASVFVKEFRDCKKLRDQVLNFVLALNTQMAQTGACTRHHEIEQRLARWILMTRDRLSANHFYMTHEMLGTFLGVRRVGVTNSAKSLKKHNLIDYSRGAIDIVDAKGLHAMACSCYQILGTRHRNN